MANRVIHDSARVFRSECKNIQLYEKELKKLYQDLEVVETQMMNLHSPNLDSPNTNTIALEDRIIRSIEEKDRIQGRIDSILDMVRWITKCIQNLSDPSYRLFISMIYLEGMKLSRVASKANLTEVRMAVTITKLLNESITPAMIREHDAIRKKIDEE